MAAVPLQEPLVYLVEYVDFRSSRASRTREVSSSWCPSSRISSPSGFPHCPPALQYPGRQELVAKRDAVECSFSGNCFVIWSIIRFQVPALGWPFVCRRVPPVLLDTHACRTEAVGCDLYSTEVALFIWSIRRFQVPALSLLFVAPTIPLRSHTLLTRFI